MTPLDRDLEHTAAALQPNLPDIVGVRSHPMHPDGTVDMDPHDARIRHCTWSGCPGIEMATPIIEGEHGYFHQICETANEAPFVRADIERELRVARAFAVAAPVHFHQGSALADEARCGASLYSPEGRPNWSMLRADVTCAACIDLLDEADFDRAHP